MGFIKHALIGIVVYEAVRYFMNKREVEPSPVVAYSSGTVVHSYVQTLSDEEIDMGLATGNNPEAPLNGQDSTSKPRDPWKDSLADDSLRAPDS